MRSSRTSLSSLKTRRTLREEYSAPAAPDPGSLKPLQSDENQSSGIEEMRSSGSQLCA